MKSVKYSLVGFICILSVMIGAYKILTLEYLVYSSETSENNYTVKIYQKRETLPVIRQAFINVSQADRVVIDHNVIFSGGFFNESFDERYPQKFWLQPDVFAFGQFDESAIDSIEIENKGEMVLDYVFIQTYRDHFIVLDLLPKSKRNIQFHYAGILSIQIMNSKGEKFGKAFTDDEASIDESTEYQIGILNADISINSTNNKIKESNCCFYRW